MNHAQKEECTTRKRWRQTQLNPECMLVTSSNPTPQVTVTLVTIKVPSCSHSMPASAGADTFVEIRIYSQRFKGERPLPILAL